jgi:bifunctional non-homologous end joining protein LigD
VLKSWAVPKGVPGTSGTNHLAVQTEDHPMEYGSFEGTIPAGEYGAGSVTIWDAGTYETEKWRDDEIIVDLDGRPGGPLGQVRLALIRTDGEGEKSTWLLHRMKDQHPRVEERPAEPDASRDSEAQAESAPQSATAPKITERPMLATAGTLGTLAGEEWALEWKWDGIRVLATAQGGGIRLLSRNGNDVTARYPELAALPKVLAEDALVDGEIVALDDEGRPSFERLQSRMNLTRAREIERLVSSVPVRLLLFDVLEIGGESVTDEPYRERRARLRRLVRSRRGVPIEVPAEASGPPDEALEESRRLGLEGIVAKRPDSRYRPGARSNDWVKIKVTRTQEVVIGGYRKGIGTRTGRIRSLLVGIPGERGLEYAGRVGSGLGELQAERILAELDARRQDTSPFVDVPAAGIADAVWVRPELVGEIEFGEWTRTGVARHPRWRGLRPDKSPDEVTREL